MPTLLDSTAHPSIAPLFQQSFNVLAIPAVKNDLVVAKQVPGKAYVRSEIMIIRELEVQ